MTMTNNKKKKYWLFLGLVFFALLYSQAQISFSFGQYTGNGSAAGVTGVGFEPDAVLIKSEGANQAVIVTKDMPTGTTKGMGVQAALTTGRITSLDSDGFTLGTDAEVNSNGVVYQWMAFETGNDLAIGTYSGTNSSVTINSIGWQPEMIWYWGDGNNSRDDATMYLKTNGEKCDRFRDGNRSNNMIGSLNSSGFTTGSNTTWGRNRSGAEYYYIAFNEGSDFLDGGFNGNTTDGRSISPGGNWEPNFVICNAAVQNHRPIMRLGSMSGDASLLFSANGVRTNNIQSITSTGFTVGTEKYAHDAWNANDYAVMKGGTEKTVTLPIELIDFNVLLIDNKVVINWKTASEINNDFFQIERSINGIDFEIIEVVSGAGNSSEVINYTTYDAYPHQGISYYRIRQIDFDGQNKLFDLISINIETQNHAEWVHSSEYGIQKLNIFGNLEGTYDVMLTDINGKVVFNKSFITTSINENSMLITLPPDLINGVYLVNIKNNEYINSGKILINHTK